MESHLNDEEFRILNYLDIFKAMVGTNAVGVSTGLEPNSLMSALGSIAGKGYAVRDTSGEQETWKITTDGENAASSYRRLLIVQSGQEEAFNKKCEEFDDLNTKFKELVTKWQIKVVAGTQIANDHSDSEYDFAILDLLFSLHEKVKHTLDGMDVVLPACNFRNYAQRLDQAIGMIRAGSFDYLVKNGASYHNIWFEMHESILKLSRGERIV